MRWHLIPMLINAFLAATLSAQAPPATAFRVIEATDRPALEAAMEQDVIVTGVVASAEWSQTGKVMNIEFKGAEDGLLVVVFARQREQLDQAFGGDLGRALSGATVRIKGGLRPYGGRVEEMKDRPQIIVEGGHQITIVELPAALNPDAR
jgi:DNA/RNA endonuclease YhcR with UshA esterase domain